MFQSLIKLIDFCCNFLFISCSEEGLTAKYLSLKKNELTLLKKEYEIIEQNRFLESKNFIKKYQIQD